MANGSAGGDWIRTLTGAAGAITAVFVFGHLLIIQPQNVRIEKLEIGRDVDRDKLAAAYTLIQTNDQYKKLVEEWKDALRRDLDKTDAYIARVGAEQQRRTSGVASIASLEKEIGNLRRRLEETERRSAPTIIEEVKALRAELDSLRQRIMVPITTR